MTKKEKAYIEAQIAKYHRWADNEWEKGNREADKEKRDEAYSLGQRYDEAVIVLQTLLEGLEELKK